jgi:serine/threonine-protein kinase HipA
MADGLALWLNGAWIATLRQDRARLVLEYTDEAFQRFPLGSPVLSLDLPMVRRRYTHGKVRPFVDGLLPEGDARRVIALDLGLAADDAYGLIDALGRDCAGALVVQPVEAPAPSIPTVLSAEPLSEAQVADLVANLRNVPLGIGARVRLSLAGVQEKLLLTRMPDGRWGRPVDGTPSTHILKPEIAAFPNTIENEAFCMRFAHRLGLTTASVETLVVQGRKLLAIERYDRIVRADGSVERLHQEDFCQAFGVLPDKKYQDDGGPSLRRIAELLQTVAAPPAVEQFLAAVTVNVLLGNGDAHGKNFSLVHRSGGSLALAPLYDLLCTLVYGDDRLAMYVDDVRRTNRVTVRRIVNEAVSWGLPRRRAEVIVSEILDRAPAATSAAQADTAGLPPDIPELVLSQHKQLLSG